MTNSCLLRALIAAAVLLTAVPGCRMTRKPTLQSLELSQKYFHQADAAMREGDSQQAESYVRQSLKRNPNSDDSRILYAKILWEKNQRQQAIETLVPAASQPDASAAVLLEISQMYLSIPDLEHARYTIGKCVMKYPSNPDIWRVRAQYYELRGNPEQAWADLHHSLSLDRNQHNVRLDLAKSYLANNQPQRALEAAQYVLTYAPTGEEPVSAFALEGRAFYALNRYPQAESSFQIAAARNPSDPDVYFYLASAQSKQGKYVQALASADEGLKIAPTHPGCRDVVNMIQTAAREATIR